VLASYDGLVKVSDGVSRGYREVTMGPLEELAQRFAYQAPECFRGGPIDRRSDLYAVGAILWEGVVGQPRAVGVSLQDSINMRLQGSEPDIASACPGVLPALAASVRRALATDPSDRHQSARELREELEVLTVSDAFRAEGGSLFGFMCNHFCEEHAALQKLLDERAKGVLHTPPAPGEALGTGSEGEARGRDISLVVGEVVRATSSPPSESIESSSMRRRLRRGVVFLSIAGAAALGVIVAWPPRTEPRPAAPLAPITPPAPSTGGTVQSVAELRPALELGAPAWEGVRVEEEHPPVRGVPDEGSPAGQRLEEAPAPAPEGRAGVRRAGPRRQLAPKSSALAVGRQPVAMPPSAAATPAASPLAGADAETFFALAESIEDGTGVDLRTIKKRPPRAIDKQDPYSP
jgi:serine/threonine-protein kinase